MTEYDNELDAMYLQLSLRECHRALGPKPWEWRVCNFWHLLSPEAQHILVNIVPMTGMELHVLGPGLAFIYNPRRPSRWTVLKRIFL